MTTALLFFLLGLPLGLWHFGSLHWLSAQLAQQQQPRWAWMLGLHLLRLILMGAACYLAVRQGAWALLALALGVVVARPVVTRLAPFATESHP
jgi:F1F0 ATPase subunit 2